MTILQKGLFAAALVASTLAAAAPAQAHDRRGGNDAAIAIGAGVVGLAIGAAIASDRDDRGYYDGGYYGGGYNYRSYPRYRTGYYYNSYPAYNAYPVYRSYPAYRGYDDHYYRERRWREHERWEHRGYGNGYGHGYGRRGW